MMTECGKKKIKNKLREKATTTNIILFLFVFIYSMKGKIAANSVVNSVSI